MENEELKREVKGIWIPIEVWERKDLSVNEKVLFAEVDSYTTKDKDCFMSDEYISKFLGINKTNANKTLSSLIKKGLVIKTRFDGRKRYIKAALSQTTTLTCQQQQGSNIYNNNSCISNDNNISLPIQSTNKESNTDVLQKKDDLFEECWKAYRRKGVKKPAKAQWQKLSDKEKESVLPHIKAYVATREVQFQKDFERYLRDRLFNEVVYGNNKIVYDPQKAASKEYMPSGNNVYYDELRDFYYYTGFYMRSNDIMDGYADEERPDGAKLCLNNARGVIQWNANNKEWRKQL